MFLYRHLKARILESQTASNQNEKKNGKKKKSHGFTKNPPTKTALIKMLQGILRWTLTCVIQDRDF